MRFYWVLIYPFGDEQATAAHSSILISWISPLTYWRLFCPVLLIYDFLFDTSCFPKHWSNCVLGTQYHNPKILSQSGNFTLELSESSLFYMWSWGLFCLWLTLHMFTLQISSAIVFVRIFCSSSQPTLIFVTLSNLVLWTSISVTSVLHPLNEHIELHSRALQLM